MFSYGTFMRYGLKFVPITTYQVGDHSQDLNKALRHDKKNAEIEF